MGIRHLMVFTPNFPGEHSVRCSPMKFQAHTIAFLQKAAILIKAINIKNNLTVSA